MFETGISANTKAALGLVATLPWINKYYLAGGTAVALQIGHRLSYDLDFFSPTPESSRVIIESLKSVGEVEIIQNDEGTFNGSLNGVKISFFIYSYPLLEETSIYQGVNVVSMKDLGCMKLDAIGSRGTKRDFVDLFFITQHISLDELLEVYRTKFGQTAAFGHTLKSLVYFTDAEGDDDPNMLVNWSWDEVKEYFVFQARSFAGKWKL